MAINQSVIKLERQLKELKGIDFSKALLEGAEAILEQSKKNTPVKTGFLRDSQEIVETDHGLEIRVNADYAAAVEYGTYKQNAQPYLRPAIAQTKDKVDKLIASVISKEIADELR